MDKKYFNEKIRNALLKRILATAALILVALSLIIFFVTRRLVADELKEKTRYRVDLAASFINNWLSEKSRMLLVLADHEAKNPSSVRFKKTYFAELGEKYGGVQSAYMGYTNGVFVTGSDFNPPPGWDARKRPWYLQAVAAQELVFTTPYIDALTKKFVITVAVPIYRRQRLIGVMAMDIFITDIVNKVEELKVVQKSSAFLIEKSGLYIAATSKEEKADLFKKKIAESTDYPFYQQFLQQGAKKSGVYESSETEDYLIISPVAISKWFLFFHLPFSEINEPLKQLAFIFTIGILIGLAVLSLTIVVISNLIARPVLSLATGAEAVALGDYDRQVEVQSRDEIGYLTHNFNDMTAGLKDREFIKTTFGRYVSPDVMNDILDGNIEMGGENKVVTILFSDVRKFTTISEKMEPQKLVSLLNSYFTDMDKAVVNHGGSINKYMGDGILAIFGAPNKLENHALSAVQTAEEMLSRLDGLVKHLTIDLKIGIGIHTGEVVIGNIGSPNRTEYTVIGDSVNLAARIESLTKAYGQLVLISSDTGEQVAEKFISRMIDKVKVKGKNKPIYLVTPIASDAPDAELAFVLAVNKAMDLYFAGEFGNAIAQIEGLLREGARRRDKHLFLIRRRCKQFLAKPPVEWDGVYTFTTK